MIWGYSGIIILWITVHYAGLYAVSYFAIFLAAAGYAAQAPIVSASETRRSSRLLLYMTLHTSLHTSDISQVGAWTAENFPNPSKRAAAIGFLRLFGSIGGGSIGSNIFLGSQVSSYCRPLSSGTMLTSDMHYCVGTHVPPRLWLRRRRHRYRRDDPRHAPLRATCAR
jgi:hypothetical protein